VFYRYLPANFTSKIKLLRVYHSGTGTSGARVSDPDSHRVAGTSNVQAADLDLGGRKRTIKIEE
jgi:hypothetical protein